jgi:NitT/TauT family transport system substrate-binding protein
MRSMQAPHLRLLGTLLTCAAILAACGGAAAPAPSAAPPSAAPASSAAAAAKPSVAASAAANPAGSASAKPAAASGSAAAKPSAAAAGSAAAKPAAGGTVKFALTSGTAVVIPVYVAKAQGFFDKAGVNVEVTTLKSAAVVPAILANEVQMGTFGSPELVNSNLGGASLMFTATVSNFPVFSLYATKDVKTVADLAGKGIGVTSAGSSTDLTAQLFLKKNNLTDKVKIVPTGGDVTGVVAAMQSGQLAAGILSPPSTGQAAKLGYIELINGPKAGVSMIHDGIGMTKAYFQANQPAVKNILKGYAQAWTFAADPANKAAVVKDLADFLKADNDLATESYDYLLPVWQGLKVPTVDPVGIQNTLDESKQANAKSVKPDEYMDNSLIQAAAAS